MRYHTDSFIYIYIYISHSNDFDRKQDDFYGLLFNWSELILTDSAPCMFMVNDEGTYIYIYIYIYIDEDQTTILSLKL